MGVIGKDEVSVLYTFARKIRNNECPKNDALEELDRFYSINKNSACDYFMVYEYMLDGKCYKRNINSYAIEYFLEHILSDDGVVALNNALNALFKHIEYNSNKNGAKCKRAKDIYENYTQIIEDLNNQSVIIDLDEEYMEDGIEITDLEEGKLVKITVNKYERNQLARKRCIEYYGCRCLICKFEFKDVYGDVGEGFIHVHHIKPLSEISSEYKVNPIKDLIPICPNCHAMIHKRTPCYTIEEMLNNINKK